MPKIVNSFYFPAPDLVKLVSHFRLSFKWSTVHTHLVLRLTVHATFSTTTSFHYPRMDRLLIDDDRLLFYQKQIISASKFVKEVV